MLDLDPDVRVGGRSFVERRLEDRLAACSLAVMRMVPAGFSRSPLRRRVPSRSPEAVGRRAEQAFARLGRRDAAGRTGQEPEAEPLLKAPHRWLSADWDTPSFAAAFVKLRSCPTAAEGQVVKVAALVDTHLLIVYAGLSGLVAAVRASNPGFIGGPRTAAFAASRPNEYHIGSIYEGRPTSTVLTKDESWPHGFVKMNSADIRRDR